MDAAADYQAAIDKLRNENLVLLAGALLGLQLYLSNYTQRQNIRIIGLPESVEMPKPADFVCNLLCEIFGPNAFEMPIIIDRIHRTAAPKPSAEAKPRPLLVRMHSFRVRKLVFRLASRHGGPIL